MGAMTSLDGDVSRLRAVKSNLESVRRLLEGRSRDELSAQPHLKAAMERLLQRASDASSLIPQQWKDTIPAETDWLSFSALGDKLQYEYWTIQPGDLWRI
jgi:uncharacterized protein with HEPN domain